MSDFNAIQNEIHRMSRNIMNAMNKPLGDWFVNVNRSAQQPYVFVVSLDTRTQSGIASGQFGVNCKVWEQWSDRQKEDFLHGKITETIDEVTGHAHV